MIGNLAFLNGGFITGFDPSTLSGFKVWFKSDYGVTKSGVYITSWDAYETTISTTKATSTTNIWTTGDTLNGIPSIEKTGAIVEQLAFDNNVSLTNYTIFVVCKTNQTYAEEIIRKTSGYLGSSLISGFGGPGPLIFDGSFLLTGGGQNLTTAQYIMFQSGSSGSVIRQNGTEVNTSASQDGAKTLTGFLRYGQSTKMNLWECLVYDSKLNSDDILQVETYLENKYAL